MSGRDSAASAGIEKPAACWSSCDLSFQVDCHLVWELLCFPHTQKGQQPKQHTSPWIRESLYKLVSKNRYKFGENDQCRIDFDGTYTSRFVSDPPASSSSDENDDES